MLNPWANSRNQVNLTNTFNITANSIELIISDQEEQIVNILDLFLSYSNISAVVDVQIPIGGGIFYTLKEWVGDITDTKVPGLQSLIEYLQFNYRRIDDDSIINNNYTINNHHHKHETFTENNTIQYNKKYHTTNNNTISNNYSK